MKKLLSKHILLLLITIGIATISNAQQTPSQRSFAEEIKKIKEKQAARNQLIKQQPANNTTQPTSTIPNQQPGDKPSERPMKVPARPVKRQ